MLCQPQLGRICSINLHVLSVLIEIKGRTVTSPFKNNLLKARIFKVYLFLHVRMLLCSAVKSFPNYLCEKVNNITGLV